MPTGTARPVRAKTRRRAVLPDRATPRTATTATTSAGTARSPARPNLGAAGYAAAGCPSTGAVVTRSDRDLGAVPAAAVIDPSPVRVAAPSGARRGTRRRDLDGVCAPTDGVARVWFRNAAATAADRATGGGGRPW